MSITSRSAIILTLTCMTVLSALFVAAGDHQIEAEDYFTIESLISLVALIFGMSVRIMVPNDAIFDESADIVTVQEIMNFVIVGTVAYFAWIRGMKAMKIH